MPDIQSNQRSHSRTARYHEIAEQFRRQIQSGELQPGDRLPSFTEMRMQFGVNQATMERIHKVLEADGLIRREVGRGTFITRPEPKSRSGIIGLSGHGFTYAQSLNYSAELMAEFRGVLSQENAQAMLLDDDSVEGWQKVDGVLMYDSTPSRTLRWLKPQTPCVSLLYAIEELPSVVADDFAGVEAATQHLIELGHRRIAYLTTMGSTIAANRLAGYRAAMRAAKIKVHSKWIRWLQRPQSELRWMSAGSDNMQAWLEEGWGKLGCTALLVQNDEAAIGAMKALQAAGYTVPDDVSVVGFDGMEICDFVTPRLTTMEVPLREIGARGLQLLLRQINKLPVSTSPEILPVKLRGRESTAPPR